MSAPSEKGHAVNLASANGGIILATEMAATFNPANPILFIPAQKTIYDSTFAAQQDFITDLAPYSLAVDARQLIFEPLPKWLTRFRANYATAPGVDAKIMEDLATIIRDLKGLEKYKPEQPQTPPVPTDGTTPIMPIVVTKKHSNIHSSFDQRTNKMFEFAAFVKNTPGGYITNVPEFSQAYIDNWAQQMLDSTAAVASAAAPLAISRTARNHEMYFKPNALVTVGKLNRKYIMSITPKGSPIYNRAKALTFSDYKE